MNIDLIGLFRVGTNFTRTVLENNYNVDVWYDRVGWKHGIISDEHSEAKRNLITVIKDPFACLDSWFEYTKTPQKNIKTSAVDFREFLRLPVIFSDGQKEGAPQYYFSNPIQMWNTVVWNHVNFATSNQGYVLRYEDLLIKPKDICDEISRHFGFTKKRDDFIVPVNITKNMNDKVNRNSENDYVRKQSFNKKDYFLKKRYLSKFSFDDKRFVYDELSDELVESYYPERSGDYVIYTMANDNRLHSLEGLLYTNSIKDNVEVRVIPFDNVSDEMKGLCDKYQANIITPDAKWDKLGKSLYKNEEYRDGVKAWNYFRKFNCFNGKNENFIFLDANSLICASLKSLVNSLNTFDFVFGTNSANGRNFTPWSQAVLNIGCTSLKNGFNAGLWSTNSSIFNDIDFELLSNRPNIRTMLTKSPEQSFLSLLVAQSGKKVCIADTYYKDINVLAFGENLSEKNITVNSNKEVFLNDKIILCIKWTGAHNHKGIENPLSNWILEHLK